MKGQPRPMKMTQYTGNLSKGSMKVPKNSKAPKKGKMPAKSGGKRGCSCGG